MSAEPANTPPPVETPPFSREVSRPPTVRPSQELNLQVVVEWFAWHVAELTAVGVFTALGFVCGGWLAVVWWALAGVVSTVWMIHELQAAHAQRKLRDGG